MIKKEINDFFKSKTAMLLLLVLVAIISYSFYSAVDLYSKASVAAVNNSLYAGGFEPVRGIFAPSLGGLFIILSLIAPFLFIQSISNEKKQNTITLLAQLPYSFEKIFLIKFFAAAIFLLTIFLLLLPLFLLWYYFGGHIPINEIILLLTGYFLYGTLIIAISFFSSSLFDDSGRASILAVSLIMFSWFWDFGSENNIGTIFSDLSQWSITGQLKQFENGILSLSAVFYFILLILLFLFLSYIFLNFSIRNKIKPIISGIIIFILLFWANSVININFDLTESRRNSFSYEKTNFLKMIPHLNIKIFLDPADSRAIDYSNDFLKKIKLIKNDITITYITGKDLKNNYGLFQYTINGNSETTYSNSEEEIFMILANLSGIKLKNKEKKEYFKGYPLVVKGNWKLYILIFYFIPIIIGILFYYLKNQLIPRRREI